MRKQETFEIYLCGYCANVYNREAEEGRSPLLFHSLSSVSASYEEIQGQVFILVVPFQRLSTHILRETHLLQLLHLIFYGLFVRVSLRPLLRRILIQLLVSLVLLRHLSVLRIIYIPYYQKLIGGIGGMYLAQESRGAPTGR